jgi:hypothetical protein
MCRDHLRALRRLASASGQALSSINARRADETRALPISGRIFVNGENLIGVRQTRWDPLLLLILAVDARWTVDAWVLLEGRNINGGRAYPAK